MNIIVKIAVGFFFVAAICRTNGAESHPQSLTPVPIQQVIVDDGFWSPKRQVWRNVTIPDVFNKFEKDGAIRNYDRVRDGVKGGHEGPPFLDGLLCEAIRGTADFLAAKRNADLEGRLDDFINHIAAAQAKSPDGFINTATQLMEPEHRWGLHGGNDVIQHDVYNAGCLVEAGVHYYLATGKTKLLEVGTRLANTMCDVMGPPPRSSVIPGHGLPEEALTKLYLLYRDNPTLKQKIPFAIDEHRYLELAMYWIENRGDHSHRQVAEHFADYYDQDHMPVLQQSTIEGHAVRATLMCAGLSALADVNRREDYRAAAERLWKNLTGRRIYVTGGVGAVAKIEGFAPDYVLPNDGYLESCAAIGSAFFSRNMNLLCADAACVDELERVLYNGALCATSLKGDSYYYQNPLDVKHPLTRWSWHGCPCCPPMFLKIMGAMPGYIYAHDDEGINVNLFVGSRAIVKLPFGKVELKQTTGYPWYGKVKIVVTPEMPREFSLRIRVPSWCQRTSNGEPLYQAVHLPVSGAMKISINGTRVEMQKIVRGYAVVRRQWNPGDVVDVTMKMPVERVKANPNVEADRDRVAIMRGPIVYCMESVDNPGGMRSFFVPEKARLMSKYRGDMLGGVTVVKGTVRSLKRTKVGGLEVVNARMMMIPYYANSNRKPAEMMVWLPETSDSAQPLPLPTLASIAQPSASHCCPTDTLLALNDGVVPTASDDLKIPRFTWWDHRGTKEWVEYNYDKPQRVSGVELYWWDERRIKAHCRVPQSWTLFYKKENHWVPVSNATGYGVAMDGFNPVQFKPVTTTGLRVEVQLQPEWSGGILEWRVK